MKLTVSSTVIESDAVLGLKMRLKRVCAVSAQRWRFCVSMAASTPRIVGPWAEFLLHIHEPDIRDLFVLQTH